MHGSHEDFAKCPQEGEFLLKALGLRCLKLGLEQPLSLGPPNDLEWTSLLLVATGPTTCLMLGAAFYILYCFQLLLTSTIVLYSSAVLLGAGASIIWVAQGFVLANNSNQQEQLRNSGLFWLLFHLSGILGNIPVLFLSESYEDLSHQAKNLVCISSFSLLLIMKLNCEMTVFLLCLTSTGGLVLLLFKQTRASASDVVNNRKYQQKFNNTYQYTEFI